MSARLRTLAVVGVVCTLLPLPSAAASRVGDTLAGPVAASPSAPLRVVAAPVAIRDSNSNSWLPDDPYTTLPKGLLVSTSNQITGTANPELYQHARLGVSGYQFPVQVSGTYFVDILTAETRGAQPGARRWDVTAEGHTVASAVDVAYTAGQDRPWHVMFPVIVTDGTLDLKIVARKGLPMVSAVEVDYESAQTSRQTLLSDNFNGPFASPPNPQIWGHDIGGSGWGHNEQEYYTDSVRNAGLDGKGHLAIVARREKYTGSDGVTQPYTSARLKTADKFTFQYGTAIARMRVPRGAGLWPAFWALGANFAKVHWPKCGEVDITEQRGSQPRTAYAALHAQTVDGNNWLKGEKVRMPTALWKGYHDYGLVWGPSGIAISVDGRVYLTISTADATSSQEWNFDHPFFLILNLAVGGRWGGAVKSTTHFPAILMVDSVRVTS